MIIITYGIEFLLCHFIDYAQSRTLGISWKLVTTVSLYLSQFLRFGLCSFASLELGKHCSAAGADVEHVGLFLGVVGGTDHRAGLAGTKADL